MNTSSSSRATDRVRFLAHPLAPTSRPDAPIGIKAVVMTLMLSLVQHFDFSEREQDVLQLILLGRDNDLISQRLGIGVAATRWHVHAVFNKTETSSRKDLIDLGLRLSAHTERAQA